MCDFVTNRKKYIFSIFCALMVMTAIHMSYRGIVQFETVPQEHLGSFRNQLKSVALELSKAQRVKRGSMESHLRVANALQLVLRMIQQYDGTISGFGTNKSEEQQKNGKKHAALLDVCPEKYVMREKRHVITNCSNARQFHDVVSILLNGFDYKDVQQIVVLLREINATYPSLAVHLAVKKRLVIPRDVNTSVIQHVISATTTSSEVWHQLVGRATTGYVLVGRRIEHFMLSGLLERMVRVVSELGVDVVGGAVRTPDGHWSMGCQQTRLRNYTLTYVDGYYMSASSCAYCDYIVSPFVGRTSTLRDLQFNSKSPITVFRDYFLRLRRVGKLTVSCPDAMFYIQADKTSTATTHSAWIPIVRRLRLNVVEFSDGSRLSYSCKEAGISCAWTRGILIPICCLETLVKGIKDTFYMCKKLGIYCHASSGTAVGAVKFSGVLPWELDADISYQVTNKTSFWWHRDEFKKLGWTLEIVYLTRTCPKYINLKPACEAFVVRFPNGWGVDVYGSFSDMRADSPDPHLNQTKVMIAGLWVNSYHNPGRYVRDKYGHEVLKHVEHWAVKGIPGNQLLKSGQFEKCPKKGSHFCLDMYSPDGNINLMGP